MAYTAEVLASLVPITQFNRGQASRIFDRLHTENQLIVLKNNQPTAVILSPSEFSRLSEIEEDYALLLEAADRLVNSTSASTSSMSEVMSELGISEAELTEAEDVVIE
jgi:PHD/YefM family antitoxin component YafN of YafNO toxin-antitoxin module